MGFFKSKYTSPNVKPVHNVHIIILIIILILGGC